MIISLEFLFHNTLYNSSIQPFYYYSLIIIKSKSQKTMALTKIIPATILLTFTLFLFSSAKTRPLLVDLSLYESQSYISRLNLDENSTNCWDSLLKLQSCTGEFIQFFYNGDTHLGSECCNAIIFIV